MKIQTYTGGLAETNAYLVEVEGGFLAIDAPEGFLNFLKQEKVKVLALVLTHGHWDHMWDAAAIVEWAKCPVYYHQADVPLMTQPEIMKNFGLPVDLKPVKATRFLDQGDTYSLAPSKFTILHIPGHCLGSICLYEKEAGLIFGGDVLFQGGVGRWDLPGGSQVQLIQGIQKKLMTLPSATVVYPGHGDPTTIGEEKNSNPYLQD
ncbi:MAG: MBL fold metallo-hydrolase [Blastochloris sp.]|nr:MBL fold metallo-hydrolase [Blastochloris sp.]